MKFKLALTSLFFLSNCLKYESPVFYFHNVSDRPLVELNCIYKYRQFKFDDLGINSVKVFSFDIANNQEFHGKMFCRLKNFNNEIKRFKFEIKQNDIELETPRYYETKPWLMPIYFFTSIIFPSGIGENRKIKFFLPHINIYLSQDGYEILLSNDENYFKKDNMYIDIMQKNGINYTREKTLNKNLNY
jgi:hypothetical protein